jgi:hypothetical protein
MYLAEIPVGIFALLSLALIWALREPPAPEPMPALASEAAPAATDRPDVVAEAARQLAGRRPGREKLDETRYL